MSDWRDITDNWRHLALCAGTDAEAFFPEKGGGHDANAAKRICMSCEVRMPCLEEALRDNERYGIRGGLSERDRRQLRRLRRAA